MTIPHIVSPAHRTTRLETDDRQCPVPGARGGRPARSNDMEDGVSWNR